MDWGWKPWDGPVEKFFLMYLQQMTGKMGDWMGGRTEGCYQQKEDSQCPCLKDPATELSSGLTLTPMPTNISGVQCPMTFNVACSDSSLLVMV